jgi:hypothetical protein
VVGCKVLILWGDKFIFWGCDWGLAGRGASTGWERVLERAPHECCYSLFLATLVLSVATDA